MRVSVFVSMRTHMRIPWWRVYPISGFNFSISCMTHSAISTCMSLITHLCAWVEVISYKFAKRKRISSAVCSRLPLWMQLPMLSEKSSQYISKGFAFGFCVHTGQNLLCRWMMTKIVTNIFEHIIPLLLLLLFLPFFLFFFFLQVLTWWSPSLFRFDQSL